MTLRDEDEMVADLARALQACAGHERPLSKGASHDLASTSVRAWIAAFVTILAASAMLATAAAAAGKAKPEVTAIMVSPIHDAQVVRGDDGKDHVEYDLLVVSVIGDPVTLSSVTVLTRAGKELGRIDGATLAAATQNLYTHAPVPAIPSFGDVVKAGALLAKLGNTGPSTGPHLHFGLLDRPDGFTGRAVPFVFKRYTLAGTVDLATAEGDILPITPESRQVRKAYPLWGSLLNFER